MNAVVIASRNPGKIREIKTLLSKISLKGKTLADVGYTGNITETGRTFEENAKQKAKIIGRETGMVTLADDSGLEIDALGGKPGVYSSRYAPGSDWDRIEKVLSQLQSVKNRTARFQSVIALYLPSEKTIRTFQGTCEGYITRDPSGKSGFGYDPIFFSPELGKTFAEATHREKQSKDHRGKAMAKALRFLTTYQSSEDQQKQ